MSQPKSESPPRSPSPGENASKTPSEAYTALEFDCDHVYDCETWKQPEFIFGGPFITVPREEPGIFLSTPYNTELSAFYRGTKAEQSLRKDLPRLIETIQEEITKGNTGEEYESYARFMEELSDDICTNKEFKKFHHSYEDSKMWNEAIDELNCKLPLMSRFGFSEAYAHTKMNEAIDLLPNKHGYDYHANAKRKMIDSPGVEEAMYVAASRFLEKVPPGGAIAEEQEFSEKSGEKYKKGKEQFISLMQFCLWANKNNRVIIDGHGDAVALDPFQYIDHHKTKIVADESGKIFDGINNRARIMKKSLDNAAANANPLKMTCSCHRLAKLAGLPVCEHKEVKPEEKNNKEEEKENKEVGVTEKENIEGDTGKEKKEAIEMRTCPTKVTAPKNLTIDIICEQSGLELFSVLCLAHFLIARRMVEKVRFHVKKIPWYETHATANDIKNLIEFCENSTFAKPVGPLPPPIPIVSNKKKKGKKGKKVTPPPEPQPVSAPQIEEPTDSSEPPQLLLQILGQKWSEFLSEGRFIIANDPFWVSPYTYKQMKSKAPWLYRSLQLNGIGAMFIGDINYRKLLNEIRVLEGAPLENALQGFNPAPIIVVRNINCELLCGLAGGKKKRKKRKKKKQAASVAVNPDWFSTDDYGVIQYYGKPDTSKHVPKPCAYYGIECLGGESQLVKIGVTKSTGGGGATGAEGDEASSNAAMLNVCTFPIKDNLCD